MVVQQQTVFGFFEDAAEARQAVQLLLARSFTGDNINLSTPTNLSVTPCDSPTAQTEADNSSGRFLSSLFGNSDAVWPGVALTKAEVTRRGGTLVTVKTESAVSAKQVAELLNRAGAGDIAIDGQDPNAD